jgi:hypothetical protein
VNSSDWEDESAEGLETRNKNVVKTVYADGADVRVAGPLHVTLLSPVPTY